MYVCEYRGWLEETFQALVLYSHLVGSGAQTQVSPQVYKCLYPLYHFAIPRVCLLLCLCFEWDCIFSLLSPDTGPFSLPGFLLPCLATFFSPETLVSHSPGWLQTPYIFKDNVELLTALPHHHFYLPSAWFAGMHDRLLQAHAVLDFWRQNPWLHEF